ncbi:NAD(P)H-hydrate dehydratase [Pontibaca salina]|uniref:Bifunctional NAD(P)H-hydrate repair enzyme n=1 Tax=Pontibaca salina TaxID=2795731 RepID=A0A934HQQ5_9RHOB|nr:NAD(P)H-hydrate dehydratase [Pontibaca salina]MBI6628880.1 NAD(P)H-hydrate dehydratase [Pontibaca salina]
MTELLSAAQMRTIENAAIDSGDTTGLILMERAGQAIVEAILKEWPEWKQLPRHAVVLCGPGNNGGDGFVVARLLQQQGWRIDLFLYGDAERLPPDARQNYDRWAALGSVHPLSGPQNIARLSPDLILDALFGTGLTRPVDEMLVQVIGQVATMRGAAGPSRLVAVDMPSGLCSDSGRQLVKPDGSSGTLTAADMTVTFERARLGHRLSQGSALSGKTVVKSIGLDQKVRDLVSGIELVKEARSSSRRLAKSTGAHKYSHGHALVLAGGAGRTGAARLAARGALRIGAGLVTLGVPGSAQQEVASQITALMLERVDDGDALGQVLEDARINALCLGPGLGLSRARDLVTVALTSGRACVLDADALTVFSDDPQTLFDMLHKACVLTPHEGEFARLFADIADKLATPATTGPAYSRVDATRAAAQRAGCVVLLKGSDTVIAAPDGTCAINSARREWAAPWLATAGAGDVLAGFITGLLARGLDPMQAAEAAAWLHVECARKFGPGLIAEDIAETLPLVLRKLT